MSIWLIIEDSAMACLWEPHIKDFVLKVKNLGVETFVETGTYTGGGALWASQHFARVITIELNLVFHSKAMEKCAHRSNIEFHLGDSKDILPNIIDSLSAPAMIWLDAHSWPELYEEWPQLDLPFSGCPLKDELKAIVQSDYRHFILIDDTGYFDYRQPEWAYDWPTTDMIRELVGPRGYHTEVKVDQIAITPDDDRVPFYTPVEMFMQ